MTAPAAPRPGVVPPLFVGLVDDAAIFPPGNLPLPDAVRAHRAHRAAWYADLVGPFLVSSTKLPELAELADPGRPLRVVIVAVGGAAAVGDAVRTVLETPGLVLEGVETAGDTAEIINAYHEHVPEDVCGAIEVKADDTLAAALDAIATTRHRAKFRTGGTAAEAFPSEGQLGAFIAGCVARGLPFKLTAGLHNALRHTDPETGFAHHGFLNVVCALRVAQHDKEVGLPPVEHSVAVGLGDPDPGTVADATRDAAQHAAELRAAFTGFGSCSVTEPLDDLIALGLITPPAETPAEEQHP